MSSISLAIDVIGNAATVSDLDVFAPVAFLINKLVQITREQKSKMAAIARAVSLSPDEERDSEMESDEDSGLEICCS
jgi:hypothetical protein